MTLYPMTIAGVPVHAAAADPVLDPATGAIVGHAPRAGAAEVDRAVVAARGAFPAWVADENLRREALRLGAARLAAHGPAIAELLTREQGKPLVQARAEVDRSADALAAMAGLDRPAERHDDPGGRAVELVEHPFGVVAAITPWNVPLILLFHKVAPALRAGNSVVIKPSEHAPLSTLAVGALLADIFPPGVVNVISGDGETGALLARHPGVANISFTGSVATGRRILQAAAERIVPVTLELGGNDPAIVLADAPVDAIAEKIFWGAFANSGQICFAIKRLYVHDSLHDALVAALVARADRTVVGNGLDPATELGPLTMPAGRDRVERLIDEARSGGAILHGGGRPLGRGNFLRPAILTNVAPDARIVVEEQFGPALPVLRFSDVDAAIAAANASEFGLGASVWTADAGAGRAILPRLASGLAWVNTHMEIDPRTPKGGWNASGLGYEGARWGYERFVRIQSVVARPLPVGQGDR